MSMLRIMVMATLALCVVSPAGAAGADRAFGEYLAGECVACHLPSGRQVGAIPAIVGWPPESFVAVMQSYARKERDHVLMQTVAAKFKEDELAALAAYFGGLKVK